MDWKVEEVKVADLFTWIYRDTETGREYISGTAGRIRITDAQWLAEAMNEYQSCVGEMK